MVAIDDLVEDLILTASIEELVRARHMINGRLDYLNKEDTLAKYERENPKPVQRPLEARAPMDEDEEQEKEEIGDEEE